MWSTLAPAHCGSLSVPMYRDEGRVFEELCPLVVGVDSVVVKRFLFLETVKF
ncbi:UNVERIFIED_CONTAM: hypothetical protein FKN15_053441 [Acipenser sinensis]